MNVPLTVNVSPLPIASFPDVSVNAVLLTILLPRVAEPPPLIINVEILFVVAGVVSLKKIVPKTPVAPIVMLAVVLPVKYFVVDMPVTVPFMVNVRVRRFSELFAPVKVSAPFTVALPDKVNALVDAELNSRLPRVAADMLLLTPVIVILPPVLLLCIPAPAIFPAQVIMLPPSASVPVRVRVVPTLRLFASVVVPALAVNAAKLFVVPGAVWSK